MPEAHKLITKGVELCHTGCQRIAGGCGVRSGACLEDVESIAGGVMQGDDLCSTRRALAEARKLIMKGCDLCPTSEDVWLEAARLQTPEHAKALLARGVGYNQTSVKLWIQVCSL